MFCKYCGKKITAPNVPCPFCGKIQPELRSTDGYFGVLESAGAEHAGPANAGGVQGIGNNAGAGVHRIGNNTYADGTEIKKPTPPVQSGGKNKKIKRSAISLIVSAVSLAGVICCVTALIIGLGKQRKQTNRLSKEVESLQTELVDLKENSKQEQDRLQQRIKALEDKLEQRIEALEEKLEQRIEALEEKLEQIGDTGESGSTDSDSESGTDPDNGGSTDLDSESGADKDSGNADRDKDSADDNSDAGNTNRDNNADGETGNEERNGR